MNEVKKCDLCNIVAIPYCNLNNKDAFGFCIGCLMKYPSNIDLISLALEQRIVKKTQLQEPIEKDSVLKMFLEELAKEVVE